MGTTNYGNANVTFDYKEPATGQDFGRFLKGVIKPGFYYGGTVTRSNPLELTISPFIILFNVGDNQIIHYVTSTSFTINATGNQATPILYFTYTWADSESNWLDIGFRALASARATNEITVGLINFDSPTVINAVTPITLSYRTYGLIDESGNVNVESNLFVGSEKDTYFSHTGTAAQTLTGGLTVTGISNVTGLLNANGGIVIPTGKSVAINGNSTLTVGTGATVLGGTLNVTGATTQTGLLTATAGLTTPQQITTTIATGTAPLVVTSTTKVNNLNVDQIDNVHVDSLTNTRLLRYNSSGTKIENSAIEETAGALNGITTISMNNVLTNTYNGGAPMAITSTTVVPNLNSDMVDGKHVEATLTNNSAYIPESSAVYNAIGVSNSSLVKTALNASGNPGIFACRAWVNFTGSGAVTKGSGNVSSVTYNTVGDYTINFITAMPDVNYGWCGGAGQDNYPQSNFVSGPNSVALATWKQTGLLSIKVFYANAELDRDTADISVMIFR